MIDNPWLQIVLQFGALGIVAYGAHYVLSVAIPALAQTFTEEIRAQRAIHVQMEAEHTKQFIQCLSAQRTDFLASLGTHLDEVSRCSASLGRLTEVVTRHDDAMRLAHSRELEHTKELEQLNRRIIP